MAVPNRPLSQNKYSEQNMGNTSFDETFGVNAVETLSFNPVTTTLERISGIQGNASFVLTYDGSGNLTDIDKTVNGITYHKDLTYTGTDLTGISVWTQV